MNSTKERPIIFSGPMVRAILEGRKTQTRRVVKPQPDDTRDKYASAALIECLRFWQDEKLHKCPHGQPGDRLWVRETYNYTDDSTGTIYRASVECVHGPRWKSPMFMPRKASRLTLEIVNVRVDRLQDISEDDLKAEGVTPDMVDSGGQDMGGRWINVPDYYHPYAQLWESIHGPGSWAANPWVWVIEFRKV